MVRLRHEPQQQGRGAMSRKQRTTWLQEKLGTLEDICGNVANGGSLIDWCAFRDVRYSDMVKWIDDPAQAARKNAYHEALEARVEWTVQRILDEVRLIGTVDIREAYEADGTLRAVKEMPADVARAIVGIETTEIYEKDGDKRRAIGCVRKVKFLDKLRALELLGKTVAMFSDKVEHGVADSLATLLERAMAVEKAVKVPKRTNLN